MLRLEDGVDHIGEGLGVVGNLLGGSGSSSPSFTSSSLPSITLYTVYVVPLCGIVSLNGNPHLYLMRAVCKMFVTSFILRLLSRVAGEMSG